MTDEEILVMSYRPSSIKTEAQKRLKKRRRKLEAESTPTTTKTGVKWVYIKAGNRIVDVRKVTSVTEGPAGENHATFLNNPAIWNWARGGKSSSFTYQSPPKPVEATSTGSRSSSVTKLPKIVTISPTPAVSPIKVSVLSNSSGKKPSYKIYAPRNPNSLKLAPLARAAVDIADELVVADEGFVSGEGSGTPMDNPRRRHHSSPPKKPKHLTKPTSHIIRFTKEQPSVSTTDEDAESSADEPPDHEIADRANAITKLAISKALAEIVEEEEYSVVLSKSQIKLLGRM